MSWYSWLLLNRWGYWLLLWIIKNWIFKVRNVQITFVLVSNQFEQIVPLFILFHFLFLSFRFFYFKFDILFFLSLNLSNGASWESFRSLSLFNEFWSFRLFNFWFSIFALRNNIFYNSIQINQRQGLITNCLHDEVDDQKFIVWEMLWFQIIENTSSSTFWVSNSFL